MQKNIVKFLVKAMVSSTLFGACKKDDSTTAVPDKVRKLMTTWKISSISTPKINQPDTDSVITKACMSDDIILFSNVGFDFQDGTSKCDSSIFHYAKGNTTAPAKYASWKAITLNDTLMQIKYTDSLNPAKKGIKNISFKH